MKKRITLCADDYSFTPAVSEAIIQLLKQERLSAVSCMTNTANWKTHANWLKPYCNKIDIGLHFTLTDVKPKYTKQFHHSRLILEAYAKKLDFELIKSELKTQIDRFQEVLGCLPNFIDGHQHIHQLPVIRKALITVYQETFSDATCYVRVPSNGFGGIKTSLITLTGAMSLKRTLLKNKIPFNKSFSGIYNFSQAPHYQKHFQRFLHQVKQGGLIMCHPGLDIQSPIDNIATLRWHEFRYLNSSNFLEDCKKYEVQLTPFL